MNTHSKSQLQMLANLKAQREDGLRMLRLTREQAEIVKDPCSEILLSGSNRGGKTILAAARFASIFRDIPLTTMDGEEVHCRLPHQQNRELLMWVIGDHLKHIGQTIYRVLFKRGLYKIVRDPKTGWWRSWNPVLHPSDRDIPRKDQHPSFPLIPGFDLENNIDPMSEILDCAWYHNNLNQFERVVHKNGTQMFAYAGSAEVKQGDPVDEIWLDEHLEDDAYYDEYVMRLLDNAGRIMWSTIPRDESAAYGQIEERALAQEREVANGEREPEQITTRLHRVTLANNPFIPESQKALASERLSGDRAQLVRIQGLRSDRIIAVYGEFSPDFHCVKYHSDVMNDRVTELLEANNWHPPADWTKELIIDPGTIKPAVLFGTIPPPSFWDHAEPYLIIYAEIFIRRIDAYQIAAKIAEMDHDPTFERMIIDNQMARQKPAGFSKTVGQQYAEAFETKKIQSRQSGYSFIPGDPDFAQRSNKVRTALRMRACGRPQLRIITERCPETVRQMLRNVRKTDKHGNPLETPGDNQVDDLRVCFHPSVEVLTDYGWRRWDWITKEENLATVSPDDRMVFQAPTDWIEKQFNGELLHFDSRSMDCIVTPDHRMAVYLNGAPNNEWSLIEANRLQLTHHLIKLAPNNPWDSRCDQQEYYGLPEIKGARNTATEIDIHDFAEFLGWYVSEGCADTTPIIPGSGYRVFISQHKPEGREQFEELASRLPWKHTPDSNRGYAFSSKQLWVVIKELAIGDRSHVKRVPDFIKQSSASVIEKFLIGYLRGDGWTDRVNERSITSSPQLADDIQELWLKVGMSASISVRGACDYSIRDDSGTSRVSYIVTQKSKSRASLVDGDMVPKVKPFHYSGPVYCATVPSGTLIVRRNGKVMVAGNCVEYWLSRNPTWIEPPISIERSKDPGLRAWEQHLAEMDTRYPRAGSDNSIPVGIAT